MASQVLAPWPPRALETPAVQRPAARAWRRYWPAAPAAARPAWPRAVRCPAAPAFHTRAPAPWHSPSFDCRLQDRSESDGNGSAPASQGGERSARDRSLTSSLKTAWTRVPSVRRELVARASSRCPCCSPAPSATSPLGWTGVPRIPRCRAPTSCSRSWRLA